jgi:hypothetical protein
LLDRSPARFDRSLNHDILITDFNRRLIVLYDAKRVFETLGDEAQP